MDRIAPFLHRLCLEAPWCYLSWPAAAMVIGTLIPFLSKTLASRLGVVPRTLSGLIGIVTAPFVHANLAHLAANLPPFIVLGALVLRRNEAGFIEVAATIALAEGALLWLFGRNASHVGMSGVIFGFLGYLLAVAWFTRTASDLLVAARRHRVLRRHARRHQTRPRRHLMGGPSLRPARRPRARLDGHAVIQLYKMTNAYGIAPRSLSFNR